MPDPDPNHRRRSFGLVITPAQRLNMLKRSTWIMLILLLAAAGLYWYLQKPGNIISKAIHAGVTPTGDIFGTLISPDFEVDGFSLQSADGRSLSITRENGLLMATTDHKETADQEAAESAVTQAQTLRQTGKIASAPDLMDFGLKQPVYVLTLDIVNEKPLVLKIGNPTITGDGYYLQKEDGSVVIVDKYGLEYLTNLLDAPPFAQTPTPAPAPAIETPVATPGD
jgi:hypothetical protein